MSKHKPLPIPDRTIYLIIPVEMRDGEFSLNLADDGVPGLHGNVWLYDNGPDGGSWITDYEDDTYGAAWDWLVNRDGIKEVSTT